MRILKGLVVGALVGALLTSIDGAVLGLFFSEPARAGRWLEGALRWAGYFALGGGALGALTGAVCAACFARLVLPPPTNDTNEGPKPGV